MEVTYNCWHGCLKKSEGCQNCYVYRRDESIGKDASKIYCTGNIDLPVKRKRDGSYRYSSGTVFMTCFSSDFFLKEADQWRDRALKNIKERSDCFFFCITKRPERIMECLDPKDYPNLQICCTMENQKRFNERAPIYLNLPLSKKTVIIEPMLEEVDMHEYIDKIDAVSCGGESGDNARTLDFNWVESVCRQCRSNGVAFSFHQTGARIIVDGKLFEIPRKLQHAQAKKALKRLEHQEIF